MSRNRILKFGQMWPETVLNNHYWIGADPMASNWHSSDGLVVLGRKCASLEEIEDVAAEIRADLEAALTEARAKLRK